MCHEPILALYQPYMRPKVMFGSADDAHVDELDRQVELKRLRLALNKITIKIGGVKKMLPSKEVLKDMPANGVGQRSGDLSERLQEGRKEWRLIELYVEYYQRHNADNTEYLESLEKNITAEAVRDQIKCIEEGRKELSQMATARGVSLAMVSEKLQI